MKNIDEVETSLALMGKQLRSARLERNDTMAVFAQRLGVSTGTVRAMERGEPTVQIGTWLNAFWMFDRLEEVDKVLQPRESLIDRARAERAARKRQRASRRTP